MAEISRRRFLQLTGLSLPTIAGLDATIVEPTRLRVRYVAFNEKPRCRFVQFSDVHYRGDSDFAGEVVQTINGLRPDFVVFTGDLIEHKEFLDEALGFIRRIEAPVYGAPGNHDYWSGGSFAEFGKAFTKTGGDWLVDRSIVLSEHELEIHGMGRVGIHAFQPPHATRRVLLAHYPAMADRLGQDFDLILSGHSHGGQVRVPFYGPLVIPHGVGRYDIGRFITPFGPLYVNAGIGTLSTIPLRWNCPPEITVITI